MPQGTLRVDTATVTLKTEDSATRFECRLDAGPWAACPASHRLAALAEGDHVFRARAIDGVGNVGLSPAVARFTVDTPPETRVVSGPLADPATGPAVRLAVASSQEGGTFECRTDGGAWAACSSTVSPDLGASEHRLETRAVDPSGLRDPTPIVRTIRLPVSPYQRQVLADRPASYWRFGEPEGAQSAQDDTGGYDATSYARLVRPGAVAGDPDTAFSFAGGADDYQDRQSAPAADAHDFTGRAPFSLEPWVDPTALGDVNRRVFSKEAAPNLGGYLLGVRASGVAFARTAVGGTASVATAPALVGTGQWSHLAATYDGATMRLYVDGRLEASTPSSLELGDRPGPADHRSHFDGLPLLGGPHRRARGVRPRAVPGAGAAPLPRRPRRPRGRRGARDDDHRRPAAGHGLGPR